MNDLPLDKLNPKQRMFVEHYLTSWNATKAARAAGYAEPSSQGHRLLRNVEIDAAIKERLNQAAMTADEVLARLTQQARGDIGVIFSVQEKEDPESETGKIKAIKLDLEGLLEDGPSHLIKSLTYTKYGPRIELYDAQAALQLLGKAHGLFIDRQDLNIDLSNLTDDQLRALIKS